MAGANTTTSNFVASLTVDHSKESTDPLTLQGYVKMFDDERDGPAIQRNLIYSYDKYSLDVWTKKLMEPENFESVNSLFALFHLDIKKRPQLVNLSETFLLLENVFRNVILRPYIPAYRSINIYCGRFQSFVTPLNNVVPFNALNFRESPPNLLTYIGTNQLETLMCAHTGAYLYHILKKELHEHDIKHRQSQPKQSAH